MELSFESERLLYRPLCNDDLDFEVALWSDPQVTRYITGEPLTSEKITAMMPVVTQRAGNGCIGIWSLTDRASQEQVGHALLLPLPVEADDTEFELLESSQMPDRDIEVGYVIKRSHWGLGYATEACNRLLEFAFTETDLKSVFATTDLMNLASQNVLRKCGMRDLGLIRAYAGRFPGFEITRGEWWSLRNS